MTIYWKELSTMMMLSFLLLLLYRFVSVIDVHRSPHCTMPDGQFDRISFFGSSVSLDEFTLDRRTRIFFVFFSCQINDLFQEINNNKSIDMRLFFFIGLSFEKNNSYLLFSSGYLALLIFKLINNSFELKNRFRRKKKKVVL